MRPLRYHLCKLRLSFAHVTAAIDLGEATAHFAAFAEAAGLTEEQMQLALNEMPEFKIALLEVAEASGVATDDATLLRLALGEIQPETTSAADAAKSAATEYEGQANAARRAADELFRLTEALMEQNGIAQTAETENSRYQASLVAVAEYVENAREGMEGYSRSVDANTAEGAQNRAMLAELAADSQKAALAILQQEVATIGSTAAAEMYTARLAEGRQALIDQFYALTDNYEAAVQFADQVAAMPTDYELMMTVNTAQASQQFYDFVWGLPTSIPLSVYMDYGAARGSFADGGIVAYANGGVQEFAGGGFPTGIYRGGAPIHKFAEPETGWEAYISGKPSERDRNRQIWIDTGERLGMGGGVGGDIQVNLDGLHVVLDVDGHEIGGVIRAAANQQIGAAFADQSSTALRGRLGSSLIY